MFSLSRDKVQPKISATFVQMKLIAYDIANLTDARYFAAKGAHMIGFSGELSSIDEVNAIKDWVDVPDFFIKLHESVSAETIWEWSDRTGIENFLVSDLPIETVNLFPHLNWITFYNPGQIEAFDLKNLIFVSYSQIDSFKQHQTTFGSGLEHLEAYLDISDNLSITTIEDETFSGILISGSEEDEVGVKSYESIDDVLDRIEITF